MADRPAVVRDSPTLESGCAGLQITSPGQRRAKKQGRVLEVRRGKPSNQEFLHFTLSTAIVRHFTGITKNPSLLFGA